VHIVGFIIVLATAWIIIVVLPVSLVVALFSRTKAKAVAEALAFKLPAAIGGLIIVILILQIWLGLFRLVVGA
jgi:hypothetical protein